MRSLTEVTEHGGAARSPSDPKPRRVWAQLLSIAAFGLVAVAGLWLTIVPDSSAARTAQLALAALAVCGVLLALCCPLLALIVTAAMTAAAWAFGLTGDPFVLTGCAVFVLAERRGSRRLPWWLITAAAILLVAALTLGVEGVEERFRGLLLSALVLAAAWVLGVRTREVQHAAAERSRAQERLRLARDVHDVLSYSLGAMGVRAGVAAHIDTIPAAQLRATLQEISEEARESLAELKLLLTREREEYDRAGSAASLVPFTAALEGVVRSAERAGVRAELEVVGDLDALAVRVRTTVYRIVQEAVTNVIRHAHSSTLAVVVRRAGPTVHLDITDDGCGAPRGYREGHGIVGMRERVALLGGTMHVASSAAGFRVSAMIPAGNEPAKERL